jgi:hypothetical protein
MPNGRVARGCLPRDPKEEPPWKCYEDEFTLYPRSDWPDLIRENKSLRALVKKIKNQGNEGSCASNATTQAAEIIWNMTLGLNAWIEFSPISIYRWVGSGPNSGSTISGNLQQLTEVGALPVNSAAGKAALEKMGLPTNHCLASTGYYQQFPSGWKDTSAYFVAVEAFRIDSFAGIVSASLDDFPVVYGRAGHAITCVSPYQQGSTYGLDYANSWTPSWGDQGFGKDTESFVSRAVASYGAWGLRAMLITDEALKLHLALAA